VFTGLLITVIGVLSYLAAGSIADLVRQIPVVGPAILDWADLLTFPGGRFFFPALGVFLIVWALALGSKQSWARIVGIALYALAVVYLIAILILVVPFIDVPFIAEYLWWILGIWSALVFIFGYQVYSLAARRETELSFAARYVGKPIVRKCDRCGSQLDSHGNCPKCDASARQPAKRKSPPKSRRPLPKARQPEGASPSKKKKAPRRVLARLVGAQGQAYEMQAPRLTVGRAPGNGLVLEDPSVSATHAEIIYKQGQFAVRDLGSTNGTLVNDTKVEKSRLENGSKITFGRVEFVFEVSPQQ